MSLRQQLHRLLKEMPWRRDVQEAQAPLILTADQTSDRSTITSLTLPARAPQSARRAITDVRPSRSRRSRSDTTRFSFFVGLLGRSPPSHSTSDRTAASSCSAFPFPRSLTADRNGNGNPVRPGPRSMASGWASTNLSRRERPARAVRSRFFTSLALGLEVQLLELLQPRRVPLPVDPHAQRNRPSAEPVIRGGRKHSR